MHFPCAAGIIEIAFHNKQLKARKERISQMTLTLGKDPKTRPENEELMSFAERLRMDGRYETLMQVVSEISLSKADRFSLNELEKLYVWLGEAQYQTGKVEDAQKTFRQIIEQKPDCCDGYNNLGVIYFEQGRYREAVLMFEKVLSLDPDNRFAGENLALAAPDDSRTGGDRPGEDTISFRREAARKG